MFDGVKGCIESDYEMGSRIGTGQYGLIRSAKDKYTDEEVAIKIIKKKAFKKSQKATKDSADEGKKKKKEKKKKKKKETLDQDNGLIREINILKLCQHPHIVRYISCYEDKINLYIVMEYVKGGDLLTYLNDELVGKKFTEQKAKIIIGQLVSAIEYCHGNLIAHRDIKLENILIGNKEKLTVKLADFGLSNYVNVEEFHNTFCGTFQYAAPEILLNLKYNPMLVDIWSLGVVIHVMLTGRFPWGDHLTDMQEIADNIVGCKIGYPETFSEELVDLLSSIFQPPKERATIADIKKHPWIIKHTVPSYLKPRQRVDNINLIIVDKIASLGFDQADVLVSVYTNRNDQMNALYHILQNKYGDVLDEIDNEKRALADTKDGDFSKSDPALWSKRDYRRRSPRKKLTPRTNPNRRLLDKSFFGKEEKLGVPDQ